MNICENRSFFHSVFLCLPTWFLYAFYRPLKNLGDTYKQICAGLDIAHNSISISQFSEPFESSSLFIITKLFT